jgi:hypothetical protein
MRLAAMNAAANQCIFIITSQYKYKTVAVNLSSLASPANRHHSSTVCPTYYYGTLHRKQTALRRDNKTKLNNQTKFSKEPTNSQS